MVDLFKGKYRIVREIARSNDIVYEAVDTALGRRIALKELNLTPGLTGQARRERIERFNREARAAGRLSHPNIVSVFDFGEENDRHFIAMEFLEGQTLRDQMQVRGAFPLKEALDIACQVLDALAYAHSKNVIHRDIKPDNIQILPGGQVKITDFGIARLTEEPALTSNGQVFGTPSYMSPEQIEGRSIDHRSDLFGVAVVLYEMLAGRKPFIGDSVVSITYAIMHAEAPPLPGVPPGVEQVLRRALSKSPLQRQNSAGQMKNDLRNAEQTPAVFLPPSNPTNMGRTGMGFGYQGVGAPQPSSLPPLQFPASPSAALPPSGGGYLPSNMGYTGGMPGGYAPAPPAANGGLPWSWNQNGAGGGNTINAPAPSSIPAGQPQAGQSGPLIGLGGFNPYASPPFPMRPREPLFTLSPGARTSLLALLLAVILGGGLAFGVIGVLRSYSQYQKSAASQRVATLIDQGAVAFNLGDYNKAASYFEQANDANPNAQQQDTINKNRVVTYNQLAREAVKKGQSSEASAFYEKALAIDPDNKTAHEGKASLYEQRGDTNAARRERAAAENSRSDGSATILRDHSSSVSNETTTDQDPRQFLDQRRAQARQLIQDGDALKQQGDLEGAREKWQKAMGLAPGTQERDDAKARLDQAQNTSDSGS